MKFKFLLQLCVIKSNVLLIHWALVNPIHWTLIISYQLYNQIDHKLIFSFLFYCLFINLSYSSVLYIVHSIDSIRLFIISTIIIPFFNICSFLYRTVNEIFLFKIVLVSEKRKKIVNVHELKDVKHWWENCWVWGKAKKKCISNKVFRPGRDVCNLLYVASVCMNWGMNTIIKNKD